MSRDRMEATFNEVDVANAKIEVDAYIDRIWASQASGHVSLTMDLTMYVTAANNGTSYTFRFNPKLYDTTDTLLKNMFADFCTGVSATIGESDFDAISAVYGKALITLEY